MPGYSEGSKPGVPLHIQPVRTGPGWRACARRVQRPLGFGLPLRRTPGVVTVTGLDLSPRGAPKGLGAVHRGGGGQSEIEVGERRERIVAHVPRRLWLCQAGYI